LEFYKKQSPIFIILELDTPGGEVFAAQKISDALKEMDTQYNIPIVTFINNWAISAGAMLAYSSRFITVVKDGSMGAAEPVYAGEGGKMETASEKVNSALRTDFANRARFFDRNPLIAEKMVDKDPILVLRHGSIIRLENESQIRLTGPDVDIVISPKGKLLTLNAVQMMDYGVADLMLSPAKLSEITPAEQKAGQWPAGKMLLFQAPFFSTIPQATIQSYQMDWKTRFFVFLATPLVSSLLFMGLIIGAYIEMNHPGLSLPGSIAAICLFLIVLSSFSLEIANWLELILLLTGLALILTELFVLPTFGLFLAYQSSHFFDRCKFYSIE
jgi:membrane-bound serine protease (ClpP class)